MMSDEYAPEQNKTLEDARDCPFCGSAELRLGYNRVQCCRCGAEGPGSGGVAYPYVAVAFWNGVLSVSDDKPDPSERLEQLSTRLTTNTVSFGRQLAQIREKIRALEASNQRRETMSDLKPCFCGKVPESLLTKDGDNSRLKRISGDCCYRWEVNARIDDNDPDMIALAEQAWNEAPRR